jgi:hypothetical protein
MRWRRTENFLPARPQMARKNKLQAVLSARSWTHLAGQRKFTA